MKLDVTMFRYITKEEFRVLTAVEMGMRNHEHVPTPLVESIAKINRSSCYKILQNLLRNKLVAHDGQSYDGWRMTYHGYDFLALRALAARGTLTAVGRRLGVGKESDVHYAQGPDGELVALKLHRLGRISFRAIKEKRDYLRHRVHASWMYMAKLAAAKEFAYMKALKDEGFPVPTPIDQNRHAVVMSFVDAKPLFQLRELQHPNQVLERLMRLVVRLLRAGIVHGDFNEFNLMLDEDEKVTLIDFPQIVYNSHPNAEEFFDRDVRSIVEFFRKRLNIEVQEWPTFQEALEDDREEEVSGGLKVTGFKAEEDALLVAAHEQGRAHREDGAEGVEDDEDEEDAEEEVEEHPGDRKEAMAFQPPARPAVQAAGEGLQDLLAAGSRQALEEDCKMDEVLAASEAAQQADPPAALDEAKGEDEDSDSEDSEEEAAPGQVSVDTGGRRVRKRQTAKEARANLQKQQKKKPAKANNQKCKEHRRAKAEIKARLQETQGEGLREVDREILEQLRALSEAVKAISTTSTPGSTAEKQDTVADQLAAKRADEAKKRLLSASCLALGVKDDRLMLVDCFLSWSHAWRSSKEAPKDMAERSPPSLSDF
ncbi:rio2 [Symbiodinium sp. CCMP2456]|nr:rio2 [Symbiodinium sp. CCMP2456]